MDFTGNLNFSYPLDSSDDQPFDQSRLNRPTVIRDARVAFGKLGSVKNSTELLTDGVGFVLVSSDSQVSDWSDTDQVASLYYAETHAMISSLLPEANVLSIDTHTYRDEDRKEHYYVDGIQYGPPALAVHNDYADFISEDGASVTQSFVDIIGLPKGKRIIGLNVWRSVSVRPLERFPLAVCDRTSIDLKDLEYYLNPNAPVPFNAHYCKPNKDQRWYYYPGMDRSEVLVFLTYDSSPRQGGFFTPTLHTALDMPDSKNLQPRQSVEVRVFAELPY